MEIDVGLTLKNKRGEEVTIHIPAGTIVEAERTESYVQNVAVVQDYTIKIPAYSHRKIVVRGRCLNQNRPVPRVVPGRLTPFRYAAASFDQDAIWNAMSRPRTS